MEEEIMRRVGALVQSSGLIEQEARMIIEKVIQHFELHPLRLRDLLGTLPANKLPPGTVHPSGIPQAGYVPTYDPVTGTTVWAAPAGGSSTSPWQVAFTNSGDVALRNDGTIATVAT